jgi:3-oxo-5-alpha-steroid 4-dehydrogenase 1
VSELELHSWAVWAQIGLAVVTVLALVFVSAPYGRHAREGWGPTVPVRWGWVLMELPCVVAFAAFFATGAHSTALVPLVFLAFWQLHYLNRTFVFPFRLRVGDRRMPLLIPLLAITFNVLNAWINARWIGHLGTYAADWLRDPRFICGALMFGAGWLGNLHSDAVLRALRKPGETGYKIPRGGLYRWVSAPNYLCEIVEWCGWAVMTWSPAGLAFALYTVANLAPRAWSNHIWYLDKFDDYPAERKALVPYLF